MWHVQRNAVAGKRFSGLAVYRKNAPHPVYPAAATTNSPANVTAYSYLWSGIDVPLVESRGTLVLLIESQKRRGPRGLRVMQSFPWVSIEGERDTGE